MRPLKVLAVLTAIGGLGLGGASGMPSSDGTVDIVDPAANALIRSDAKVETVYFDRFLQDHFYEGPVWHRNGNFLTVNDVPNNRIDKWENGKLTPHLTDIYKGKDLASVVGATESNGVHYINHGPNGAALDPQGRLVYCAMGSGEIQRREADGSITVLASTYNGHHINAPDDLTVKSDGAVYFGDFRDSIVTTDKTPPEGAHGPAVYRVKDGAVTLLIDNLERPNGLGFSPDEKYFYITDQNTILRYDVNPDGTVANGKILIDMRGDKYAKAPGANRTSKFSVDSKGNIWSIGPGGVWIVSPQGKHLATIRVIRIASVGWGDADLKSLYMTGPGYILRVRTNIAGLAP